MRVSLRAEFDKVFDLFGYDIGVTVAEEAHRQRLLREADRVEGVVSVEAWGVRFAQYLRPDGSDGISMLLFAVMPDSMFIDAPIETGRWLSEGDTNAIVVLGNIAHDEGVTLGDEMVIKTGEYEETYVVVGILTQMSEATGDIFAYVPYEHYARQRGTRGMANFAAIETLNHDVPSQYRVLRDVEEHFKQVGLPIQLLSTNWATHRQRDDHIEHHDHYAADYGPVASRGRVGWALPVR